MIAYHYSRTEEHAEAAAWLEKAGDRAAAIYANDTAIGNYQEARERLKLAAAEPTVFARLDEKLGAVLHTVARFDQALDVLEQAVEVYQRARDGEAVGRVTARIGRVHRDRGTVGEGIARLEPLLNFLDWSGPSRGLASVHVALAHLYFAGGRYRDSAQAAERASETARAIGDDGLLAAAEMRRGTTLYLGGETEQGVQILESVVQLAESVGDLDTLSIAVSNLGEMYFEMGALDRGKMNLERALELAERVGELASMGYSLVMIGWLLYYLGEWDHAKASIDRGAEVIRSVGSSWYSAYPPLQTARLQVAQGDWEEAARNLNECLAIAEPIGDIQALQGAHRLLGELDVLEGRPEEARARLEPLKNGERLTDQIGLLATLAWAHLELGAVDQADEIVAGALDVAHLRRNKPLLPEALRVLGMVRARQGRWDEAQTAFQESISLARSLPYPYVEARALVEYGITQVHHGELEQAREPLGAAMAIFRRLGAKKDVERTEQVLRELEVASPKRER